MKRNRHFLLIVISVIFPFLLGAQVKKGNLSEEEILKIYEDQLSEGYKGRAMTDWEIEKYISKGKQGISSINDFANTLPSLFPGVQGSKIAVLFYFFNNDSLYRFFIESGLVKERKVIPIKRTELEQLNTDIYNSLNIYGLAKNRSPRKRGLSAKEQTDKNKRYISYETAVKNATRILLPDNLSEKYEHLIIVPAFTIGAFPFQLLKPYKDNSYLIDKCSFSIASSLLDIVALRKRIIVKHEDYSYDSVYFTLDNPLFICNPSYPQHAEYIFPDLPGAKKEIQMAIPFARQYTLLEGKEATKSNVLEKIRQSDVVYFATHALSGEKNPMDNNFLVLSGDKDPFLTSRDIMKLRDTLYTGEKIFPELVILSACQTGLGQSKEAGITGGLARSFLIAGASQVIMSLWSVNDKSTAFLMNRFIFHLQKKNIHSPSEPLRLAELDTRKEFPNPADWACFSLYGVNF